MAESTLRISCTMLETKKHFRRIEVKYCIPEQVADKLIPVVLRHMDWDEYAGNNEFYPCYSLYFDGLGLPDYQSVIQGKNFRKKMRMRFYDLEKDGFLEIKRKKNGIVIKDREKMKIKDFDNFLNNPLVIQKNNWDRDFVEECLADIWSKQLEPIVWTKCKRKPFVQKLNTNFRVTFDYDLAFLRHEKPAQDEVSWKKYYEKKVILEAKFTEKMPLWFKNIIDTYKLESTGFSKYVTTVEQLDIKPCL